MTGYRKVSAPPLFRCHYLDAMADRIIGICRFSYLGRGDWGAYLGTIPGSAEEQAARQVMSEKLYLAARMEFRFQTFEALTLPSIAAQSDADFIFLVVTSPEMPKQWLKRLKHICATVPQARVLVSDARDIGAALAPTLAALTGNGKRRLVQFRLDDDDCIATGYIEHLRRAARAMRDYPSFSFSLPKALLVTNYTEIGPRRYEMIKPFHSAGAAVRGQRADQSIFSFGHYGLAKRFVAVTDYLPYGSLQIKSSGHDSQQITVTPSSGISAMTENDFANILARDFAFINSGDLDRLIRAA